MNENKVGKVSGWAWGEEREVGNDIIIISGNRNMLQNLFLSCTIFCLALWSQHAKIANIRIQQNEGRPVIQACNPSYLGDWGRRIVISRPVWTVPCTQGEPGQHCMSLFSNYKWKEGRGFSSVIERFWIVHDIGSIPSTTCKSHQLWAIIPDTW